MISGASGALAASESVQLSRKEQNEAIARAIEESAATAEELGVAHDEESAAALEELKAFMVGSPESGSLPEPEAYVAPDFGKAKGKELLGKVLERSREVDWTGMAEGLDAGSREELARFRSVVSQMEKEMSRVYNEYEYAIDFEDWKTKVDPALVSEIETIVKGLKVPSFETLAAQADGALEDLDAQLDQINQEATATLKDAEIRYAELTAEREGLRDLARHSVFGTTVDDVLDANPLMADEIKANIAADKWDTPTKWDKAEEASKALQK